MDIPTLLYLNLFRLSVCTIALLFIALHHPRYRQFFWLAIAYAAADTGTLLRMQQWKIPDFFSLVVSNLLILIAMLLIHRCFAIFLNARSRTVWVEVFLVGGLFAGVLYYTYVRPSFLIRSALVSAAFVGFAILTSYLLLRFSDKDVRTPCVATASVYFAFSVMTAFRFMGIVAWGVPQNIFVSSTAQVMGFLGFHLLIGGIPMGYFWMTSARLFANQEKLARTDPLTGLLNRRALEEHASREIHRSNHHNASFAVLSVDLDHFKQINDKYGHDAGDTALQAAARLFAATLRSEDIIARLGGEEFVAMLMDVDRAGALLTAERFRQMIEEIEIKAGDQNFKITASVGIALLAPGDTFEAVLRRADRAMYAAKVAGRNRVMFDSGLVS